MVKRVSNTFKDLKDLFTVKLILKIYISGLNILNFTIGVYLI